MKKGLFNNEFLFLFEHAFNNIAMQSNFSTLFHNDHHLNLIKMPFFLKFNIELIKKLIKLKTNKTAPVDQTATYGFHQYYSRYTLQIILYNSIKRICKIY